LIAKEGRTIDYRWVAKQIGELTSLYRIEAIAFDRWRSPPPADLLAAATERLSH
jgi:hypothetical protein